MARTYIPTLALTAALGLCATAMPALAQPASKGEAARGGKKATEVKTFKRAEPPKDAARDAAAQAEEDKKKKGPAGPELRRTRERSSADDIDDELSILRELLEIERGSETEADTLLELSYVLWDRAEAYEMEAFDERYEVGIAKADEAGDKVTARRLRVDQQNLLEQGRAAKLDVINHLKRIERAFPRFAKLDEVLYSLGYHLNELERPGEAVDAYMRLVRKTPKSGYLPDAYLGIGNYYFGKNQGGEALKWYAKVTEFPESAVYGWGLYYIAWVNYNTQQWDEAVKGFVRVLDYSKNEANGRVAFIEDGSKYLVRSWAEVGQPKNAMAFFKKSTPGMEMLLLDNLATHYAEISQYAKSNAVLEDLVELAKNDKELVRYLTLKLDNSYKLHDLEGTVATAVQVSNALKQAGMKKRPQLALLLAEISSSFHAESERTLDTPTLEAAERVYRTYGEHFSDAEHAYDMLHNHALSLFQLGARAQQKADAARMQKRPDMAVVSAARSAADQYWRESAAAYEKVIEMQPQGKYAEPSAHRAVVAYLRLQDLNQETAPKSDDTTDLRPIALTPEQQRVADGVERWLKVAWNGSSADDDLPKALFVEARLYYQNNHFDKSGKLFSMFVEKFANHELALDAARLMVSSYYLGQDGKNLIVWTDKLVGDARFTTGSEVAIAFGKTLTEIKANEEYNKCLELKATPVKAAQCLVAYATNFPDGSQAPRALAGAARFYRDAKKRDDVIATYKQLAKAFPQDPRAAQSMFEVGEILRESADFPAAADAYEDFVKTFPDNAELVPKALATATKIRESLGHFDKVVEDGELFLQHFSKDERAVHVAYKLTVQYIKKGDWQGVIRASDKFLKRSANIPIELRLAALVNTGTAQNKLGKGDKGRRLFDDVLREAKVIAESGKMGELAEVGRDAIAQALFMTGEIEFAKIAAIKGKPRNLKAAVELAAKKAKAGVVAEGYYAQAQEARNPRWIAAASSRRGRIYQEIAASIKALPAPPALKTEELKSEWAAQLADKSRPHEETAVARYREALKTAAEIFAFDSYWAEARDNLKQLDTKFAELADVKEFTVELVPFKWTESGKPEAAIKDLRYKLFELSTGQVYEEDKGPAAETVQANPEGAAAWAKLAFAHHALGQYREALVVAAVGMQAAPELKKSAALLNMMGLAQHALGNTREALLAFKAAADADPTVTEPLLNAASITIRSLDFNSTVALLDTVLQRDANNYWAHVTRPVALRRLDDNPERIKEALLALERLARTENRPEGHYNRCVIAQAVLTNGRAELQQALVACQDAVKAVGPKHPKAKELATRAGGIQQTIEFTP